MSIAFDKKCNKNNDCKSNVCEMIYDNKKAVGRFCLEDDDSYTKTCRFPKDCNSGICKKIVDHNGHFIGKKCVKAPKVDKDGSFNAIFGKSRSKNKFGVVSNEAIQNNVIVGLGEEGPVSEVIIMVLNIIADLFSIIVYDFKHNNPDKPNPGVLYSIWYSIFSVVFKGFTEDKTDGLVWGGIQHKYYDRGSGKCRANSKGINMWYIRTMITILLPPFGVFMAKGINGFVYILLSSFLTMMGYFPGLIYSFAVINSSETELNELSQLKHII